MGSRGQGVFPQILYGCLAGSGLQLLGDRGFPIGRTKSEAFAEGSTQPRSQRPTKSKAPLIRVGAPPPPGSVPPTTRSFLADQCCRLGWFLRLGRAAAVPRGSAPRSHRCVEQKKSAALTPSWFETGTQESCRRKAKAFGAFSLPLVNL